MILDTDPIGDARVAQGAPRWRRGDRVQWQDCDTGGWRQGDIVSFLMMTIPVVADWGLRDVFHVGEHRLYRVYPRGIDQ